MQRCAEKYVSSNKIKCLFAIFLFAFHSRLNGICLLYGYCFKQEKAIGLKNHYKCAQENLRYPRHLPGPHYFIYLFYSSRR